MDFPDLPHLRKLSRALWSGDLTGNAAVMVGAGVSANAIPANPDDGSFPTWGQLTDVMSQELSSTTQSPTQFFKSFPRIASEYEAAFGRKALHDSILENLPDRKYRPSGIHERLMSLPWTNIFTTNYDTLLERTFVEGKSFQTVTKASDLGRGDGPKIFKLHGSFPSDRPFIITEEDFRKYPVEFAPFVNSVRQSMLENTFVLFGFSGDDPNFLEWSGWVRDQLGREHCPIYLCGLLDLDSPRRKLLEARGVTPIDLSPAFSSAGSTPRQHTAALEWVLECLADCEPASPTSWPGQQTIELEKENAPGEFFLLKRKVSPSQPKFEFPINDQKLLTVYRKWKFDRDEYPGWVVAPLPIRDSVWADTSHWISPVIDHTENWSLPAKAILFSELIWRVNLCLAPLFTDFLPRIEGILEALNSEMLAKSSHDAQELEISNISGHRFESIVHELQISLLRDARESFNFDRWEELFKRFGGTRPTSFSLINEQLLFLLASGKRSEARQALEEFPICENYEEKWRRASGLAELDDQKSARRLAEEALHDVRDALRFDPESIRLLSHEGWVIYLLMLIPSQEEWKNLAHVHGVSRKRIRQLRSYGCDPLEIKEELESKLRRNPPTIQGGETISFGFNPLSRSSSFHYKADNLEQFLPAFAYTGLFERAAIPLRVNLTNVAGDALVSAIEWKRNLASEWPWLLLIRRGNLKPLKDNQLLSRDEVALMGEDEFKATLDICLGALGDLLPLTNRRMSGGDVDSLAVTIELLSRLAFRVESEQLESLFQRSRELYTSIFSVSSRQLQEVNLNFFERLFFAGSASQLSSWLPDILRLPPLPGPDLGGKDDEYQLEDPFCLLDFALLETLELDSSVKQEVSVELECLFVHLTIQSGIRSDRLLGRLIRIGYSTNWLSETQLSALGEWIWLDHGEGRALPCVPNFNPSISLGLPHPPGIDPIKALKTHVVGRFSESEQMVVGADDKAVQNHIRHIAEFFESVCGMTCHFEISKTNRKSGIRWTRRELKVITDSIIDIWSYLGPTMDRIGSKSKASARSIFGIDPVGDFGKATERMLAEVVLPFVGKLTKNQRKSLSGIVSCLTNLEVHTLKARLGFILHDPDPVSQIESVISEKLGSGIEADYAKGVQALFHWGLLSADHEQYPALPSDSVDRIVRDFAFRTGSGLETLFSFITDCVEQDRDFLSAAAIDTILDSLPSWEVSTRIRKDHPDRRTLIRYRYRLSRLVKAFSETDKYGSDKLIASIKSKLENDPLPEVRYPD